MLKKILLFTFLACMSIASSCFATTWTTMGPVTFWEYDSTDDESSLMKKTGKELFYDSDSFSIDYARKRVAFREISKNQYTPPEEIKYRDKIMCFYLKPNGEIMIKVYTMADGNYNSKANTFRQVSDYRKLQEGIDLCTSWTYPNKYTGRYFYHNVLYKEFAGLFNLPNIDGSPYLTPKSLGLKWIKSTSEVGVFYYPDSVKVKGNTVSAKIAVWIPGINRIEVINGKFDYEKQVLKPSSAKFYRINTGELVESHTKGLIPGWVGEALHTFRFDEDDSVKIASDFFKSKLAQ